MTTIAWDGKTLAADRGAWSGAMWYPVKKVARIEHTKKPLLIACSGDGGYATSLIAWVAGGEHPGKYPTKDDDDVFTIALVVDHALECWKLDSNLRFMRTLGRYQSIGGGQFGAMCAMLAGADARQAVQIVINCSDVAAGGVDTVTF